MEVPGSATIKTQHFSRTNGNRNTFEELQKYELSTCSLFPNRGNFLLTLTIKSLISDLAMQNAPTPKT